MPSSDVPILKSCLYLQEKYEQGDKEELVSRLKKEIRKRFGDRGAKIANLCSALYFDQYIVPLFADLKQSYTKEQLINIYNVIIEESVFAIFVSSFVKEDKLKKKILDKIESNKKYGVRFVYVHGIGKENVKKINKIIDLIATENVDANVNVSASNRAINAKITFD